jgi:hypothetical protein
MGKMGDGFFDNLSLLLSPYYRYGGMVVSVVYLPADSNSQDQRLLHEPR